MQEILFRGKRKDNGDWIYGYYCKYGFTGQLKHYIIPDCASALYSYEVIPETVGQFTGLRDNNRKLIFEGDILSEKPPMNQTAYIGYVKYDEKSAVWRFMIGNDTKYNGVLLGSYSSSYKVIGNIHDNPELLKGGAVVE